MAYAEEIKVKNFFRSYGQCRLDVSRKLECLTRAESLDQWVIKYGGMGCVLSMLEDLPSIRKNALIICRNLTSHSLEFCEEMCHRKILDLMIDSNNILELEIILSIMKNMVKHFPMAIHLMTQYSLLDFILQHLQQTDDDLKCAALRLLLELSKHGKPMCESISHFSCSCHLTENEDIAFLVVQLLEQIGLHCQFSTNEISCLFNVLNSQYCNKKIYYVAIRCLSLHKNYSDLFEWGVVEILKKQMDVETIKSNMYSLTLCRELSNYPQGCVELMQKEVINTLINLIIHQSDEVKINALYTIGNIAQQSYHDALIILRDKNIVKWIDRLLMEVKETEEDLLTACIFCLQNMCYFSPLHLAEFTIGNMFSYFNKLYMKNILRDRIEDMFVSLLKNCSDFSVLEKLLQSQFSNIDNANDDHCKNELFNCVLDVFGKILTCDLAARKMFVKHDLLRIIVNLKNEIHGKATVYPGYQSKINEILSCFPREVISYFNANFQLFLCRQI